jgi:hypothetical protein
MTNAKIGGVMDKQDTYRLRHILMTAAMEGLTVLPRWDLLNLFGYERFMQSLRDAIQERWDDLYEENNWNKGKLLIAELNNDRILLLSHEVDLAVTPQKG